jgi:hypothetical protein
VLAAFLLLLMLWYLRVLRAEQREAVRA